jgi:hypothetical protein
MRSKPRKAKPLPPFFPEKEIQPLIEAGTELPKETLIETLCRKGQLSSAYSAENDATLLHP